MKNILKTVYRERMGYIYQIHMGCKSADACANNKKANFDNPNPHYTQCRPEVILFELNRGDILISYSEKHGLPSFRLQTMLS